MAGHAEAWADAFEDLMFSKNSRVRGLRSFHGSKGGGREGLIRSFSHLDPAKARQAKDVDLVVEVVAVTAAAVHVSLAHLELFYWRMLR